MGEGVEEGVLRVISECRGDTRREGVLGGGCGGVLGALRVLAGLAVLPAEEL